MFGIDKPDFGLHPHYGALPITYVVEGTLSDSDNINGLSAEFNKTGDVYAVSGGKGVCHEEKSEAEGKHRVF
jgi:redox-sensitive bicupin YhaK (pirin superfamily)